MSTTTSPSPRRGRLREGQQVIDSTSWTSALSELFGSAWIFAKAGPRRDADWRRDVQAVMGLRTDDPRGWSGLVFTPAEGGGLDDSGPFADLRLDEFDALLHVVDHRSAVRLLVALQGQYYQASNIPDFESRRARLFDRAETLVSRFGPHAIFRTNVAAARNGENADLLNPDAEWNCISRFTTDCGIVVVSDDEVGVFWAFDED